MLEFSMPQLNIEIDQGTHERILAAAKLEQKPVSSWAREHLAKAADFPSWPSGYFEFFSNQEDDPSFKVAEEIPNSTDSMRKALE